MSQALSRAVVPQHPRHLSFYLSRFITTEIHPLSPRARQVIDVVLGCCTSTSSPFTFYLCSISWGLARPKSVCQVPLVENSCTLCFLALFLLQLVWHRSTLSPPACLASNYLYLYSTTSSSSGSEILLLYLLQLVWLRTTFNLLPPACRAPIYSSSSSLSGAAPSVSCASIFGRCEGLEGNSHNHWDKLARSPNGCASKRFHWYTLS